MWIFRIELNCNIILSQSLLLQSHFIQQISFVLISRPKVQITFNRFIKPLHGFFLLSQSIHNYSFIIMSYFVIWHNADCLIIILDSLLLIAKLRVQLGSTYDCRNIGWVVLNTFVKIFKSLLSFPHDSKHDSLSSIGSWVIGVIIKGFIIRCKSFYIFAEHF